MRLGQFFAAGLFCVTMSGAAFAKVPDPNIPHADYSNPAIWLCRPDLKDNKCKVNLDATVIAGNGKTSIEKYKPARNPRIDCFFVYPTVSFDPGWQSDFSPQHEELDNIKQQFARYGAVCRLFAPVYRQTTVTALRVGSGGAAPAGEKPPAGRGGYADVVDAWNYYMSHDNNGRGVVLIGHSQGASDVEKLVAEQIEGKPVQKQFISAIILGWPVMVPEGKDVGGTYKTIPLCRGESQTGCVMTYMSYRDTNPPPADAKFGKSKDGLLAACTNPANLATGKGEPVSYFLTRGSMNDVGGETPDWLTPHKDITTPFVRTPGLVTTTCTHSGDYTYLSMHVNADPSDHRTDKVAGEIIRATGPDLTWGLHIIDMDHSMGDFLRIVKKQVAAYIASGGKAQ